MSGNQNMDYFQTESDLTWGKKQAFQPTSHPAWLRLQNVWPIFRLGSGWNFMPFRLGLYANGSAVLQTGQIAILFASGPVWARLQMCRLLSKRPSFCLFTNVTARVQTAQFWSVYKWGDFHTGFNNTTRRSVSRKSYTIRGLMFKRSLIGTVIFLFFFLLWVCYEKQRLKFVTYQRSCDVGCPTINDAEL